MATAEIDGIRTRYEVQGDGPPLLLFSPGGFNAVLENWSGMGIYARTRPLDLLTEHFRCILFDRREAGGSGGRLERLTWRHYVQQGLGLLDHLGIDRAHLMGGCAGCSTVAAFAMSHPDRTLSMVLVSPAGGARYRMSSQARFIDHIAFVRSVGLEELIAHARSTTENFTRDPRVGPWAQQMRNDTGFADALLATGPAVYESIVVGTMRTLFDRDSVPGIEAEDMLVSQVPALIVPGNDPSHATSAARFLEECLPRSEYWDVPVAEQTDQNTPARILEFLTSVGA